MDLLSLHRDPRAVLGSTRLALFHADALDMLRVLPDNSVDALVTDPPAGIDFMNQAWDRIVSTFPDPGFLHWFAGFVDGEGCFSIHKKQVNGCETYDCQFTLGLRADDRPILVEIQRTLRIGTVSPPRPHEAGNPQARFAVSSKADCLRLVEILRAAPLRAKKARDFEIWVEGLKEWVNHSPGEWADMADARTRLMEIRRYTPYGVVPGSPEKRGFIASLTTIFEETLRVMKPGAHGLVWAFPRTTHWTGTALEDAGFEIRDRVEHLFGTGMPKSIDVQRDIEMELCTLPGRHLDKNPSKKPKDDDHICPSGNEIAKRFAGWRSALTPAAEDWWLVRKPLVDTVARNSMKHGTGGINVDACRIVTQDNLNGGAYSGGTRSPVVGDERDAVAAGMYGENGRRNPEDFTQPTGRWPKNVMLSHSIECEIIRAALRAEANRHGEDGDPYAAEESYQLSETICAHGCPVAALGEQARYFYVVKPDTAERDEGLDHLPKKSGGEATGREDDSIGVKNPRAGAGRGGGRANSHPTVKSVELMRYLCKLVTPKNGIILDPFAGSGSTGVAALAEGFRFIGSEKGGDAGEYIPIVVGRLQHAIGKYPSAEKAEPAALDTTPAAALAEPEPELPRAHVTLGEVREADPVEPVESAWNPSIITEVASMPSPVATAPAPVATVEPTLTVDANGVLVF